MRAALKTMGVQKPVAIKRLKKFPVVMMHLKKIWMEHEVSDYALHCAAMRYADKHYWQYNLPNLATYFSAGVLFGGLGLCFLKYIPCLDSSPKGKINMGLCSAFLVGSMGCFLKAGCNISAMKRDKKLLREKNETVLCSLMKKTE